MPSTKARDQRGATWSLGFLLRCAAVDDVSISVLAGETLGLVGESGCGKSTLGTLVTKLVDADAGQVEFEGRDITSLSRARLRPIRKHIQMIFQDPYASLNPRSTVGRTLYEPFLVHNIGTPAERKDWGVELLERVGLRPEHASRYPHEFSGGQRQRVAIARAIALRPKLIVCDEPVSALDVSIQAQVVNLLQDLKVEFGLSYIFITHDFSVLGHVAHRIAVMYLGRIVEVADRPQLWRRPLHPYTQLLFSAVPIADPRAAKDRRRVATLAELPSPLDPPPGCHFHTRCPYKESICVQTAPPLREVEPGHHVACHMV
jgi:oligopeptide transport system ATP-binding protein